MFVREESVNLKIIYREDVISKWKVVLCFYNIENWNFCRYLYLILFKLLRVLNFLNEMSCLLVYKCNKDVLNW